MFLTSDAPSTGSFVNKFSMIEKIEIYGFVNKQPSEITIILESKFDILGPNNCIDHFISNKFLKKS